MAVPEKIAGLLLAAGGGRRFGMPKALAVTDGQPWVVRGSDLLTAGGCAPVLTVIGAGSDQVTALLPSGVISVVNPDWASGMGSSLKAGLQRCTGLPDAVQAVMVMLVDLPGITDAVLIELARAARSAGRPLREVLAQSTFQGKIGHPVLVGRDHWPALIQTLTGDSGARSYLAEHDALQVEAGHLADGRDQDTPESLAGHEPVPVTERD